VTVRCQPAAAGAALMAQGRTTSRGHGRAAGGGVGGPASCWWWAATTCHGGPAAPQSCWIPQLGHGPLAACCRGAWRMGLLVLHAWGVALRWWRAPCSAAAWLATTLPLTHGAMALHCQHHACTQLWRQQQVRVDVLSVVSLLQRLTIMFAT
jgi:hypothetical protein